MRLFILQRFQVYARICLLVAIGLSPVIFNRGTQDVFNLLKFSVLWTAGIAGLALFLIWSAERGVWPPRFKLAIAAGAFLLACTIATIFSENVTLSLVGLYHRYGGLLPFLLYALIMAAIVGLYWERPLDLKDVAKASAAASTLLLAYVLIQAAGQDWIAWKDSSGGPPPYPVGTMGNSNFAGAYLGIAIPFVLYSALTAKHDVSRTILYVVTALDVLALWFTQTRGGMIAGFAGLLAMAFWFRDRIPTWTKIAAVGSATLATIAAVMVLWHPGFSSPPGPFGKLETFRTGTFDVRTYYWKAGLKIFAGRPLTGVGLDLYYANYPEHRVPEDGAKLGLTITDKPHNIFVEYLANAGIIGLSSYLFLVGLALFYADRAARNTEGPERLAVVTFASVLVGYLAQGFFSIDVPPLAVMGWIAIGGIAAIADPSLVAARQASSPVRRKGAKKDQRASAEMRVARHGNTRWGWHVPVALFALLALILGTSPVRADAQVKKATGSTGDLAAAEAGYKKAIAIYPLEPAYRAQFGNWYEQRAAQEQDEVRKVALFRSSLAQYRAALSRQSGNIFYLMNMARLHTSWAEIDSSHFEIADRWWKRVVEHDPTDWDVHNRYALMLNAYANSKGGDTALRERTLDQLEATVRIKPDLTASWINIGKVHVSLGRKEQARKAFEQALKLDPENAEANTLLQSLAPSE